MRTRGKGRTGEGDNRERGGNECLINNEHNLLLNIELELTVYIKIFVLKLIY